MMYDFSPNPAEYLSVLLACQAAFSHLVTSSQDQRPFLRGFIGGGGGGSSLFVVVYIQIHV